jgi:hypothetical protein
MPIYRAYSCITIHIKKLMGISNMAGAMPIKVSAVKLDGNDLFNVRGVSSFPF